MATPEMKKEYDNFRTILEEFRTTNDKRLEEIEARNGEVLAETREKLETVETKLNESAKHLDELRTAANRPNIVLGSENMTAEERQIQEVRKRAFVKYIRYGLGEESRQQFQPEEIRALSGASDADGGFLVPIEFESNIIMKAYNMAELRPICNVGTTGRDTVVSGSLAKPVVAWGRTAIAVSPQDLASGGSILHVRTIKGLLPMDNDTLEDAEADIVGELEDGFSRAIAEAEDDAFAVGAGDDSPHGVGSNSTVQANYAASGVAAALSDSTHNGVDAIISAYFKIKKTYRRNGVWAMNSTTEGAVRKLKDGNGQYLWQPAVDADSPNTLHGKVVKNAEGLPDIAAGAFPILFGDWFAGYKIRDRRGILVQRLVEKYAEYGQTAILVSKRLAGGVVLPEAFSCVKIAAS